MKIYIFLQEKLITSGAVIINFRISVSWKSEKHKYTPILWCTVNMKYIFISDWSVLSHSRTMIKNYIYMVRLTRAHIMKMKEDPIRSIKKVTCIRYSKGLNSRTNVVNSYGNNILGSMFMKTSNPYSSSVTQWQIQ